MVSSHDLEGDEGDDEETVRLSRQLDGWYRELKSNVLVSSTKIKCLLLVKEFTGKSLDNTLN